MKNCLYCGHPNPEENQFCNKCGRDIVNYPAAPVNNVSAANNNPMGGNFRQSTAPVAGSATQNDDSVYGNREQNIINYVLEDGIVKFILYFCGIFIPILGVFLGLIVSVTPFNGQKAIAAKLIRCSCIASIVWAVLAVIIWLITIL